MTQVFGYQNQGKLFSLQGRPESKKVDIVFRNSIPEIPKTTYGTFSIYKYPAKFIPQVIAFILRNYACPGMKIFDPFAGYGTTGLVARIYRCNYELWDLNPILKVIHETAIIEKTKIKNKIVIDLLNEIKNSQCEFIPKYSNLNYWFPDEFLSLLSKVWGFVHSIEDQIRYLFIVPLLKITKYFSWADEKVHKLYKSKYSKRKVEELLKTNWKSKFYEDLRREVFVLINKIYEYSRLNPENVSFKIEAGVDALEKHLEDEINILITSPPYLQAQEYIRTTKLELFWLGYDENYVRNLSKKEIPYRDVKEIEIYSERYHTLKKMIEDEHLRRLYDNYFNSILKVFSNISEKVSNYMFIFVGPAKIRTLPIPIDDIIAEHMQNLGWKHKVTYVDKIISRVMFETKVNPASGLKDERIKTEHLIVLER